MEIRNEEVFVCECFSPEHMIYLTYDEENNELYFHIHMDRNIGWWNRLKYAVLYLFGRDSAYGGWDVTLIKPEDKERLIGIINKLKETNDQNF